jgi:hypothetical protein
MRPFLYDKNVIPSDVQVLSMQGTGASGQEDITWTDDQILRIFDHLLESSLRILFSAKSSSKLAAEIYDWIMDSNDRYPFSLNNCCLLPGYNPDDIRDGILGPYQSIHNQNIH